ncbi:MAG: nucleotidyltransferase domain-containing protein [Planctomycetes bacterium]|nr:nucleotidyltransferase domain-containing protein [Planctomycetota bacterium]
MDDRTAHPPGAATRTNPRTDRIAAAVRELLGGRVSLALLFGSREKGTATPRSDLDIGVLVGPGARWTLDLAADLAVGLERRLGLEVDLVRLDEGTPLLRFEAARGTCLYEGSPGQYAGFVSRALKEYDEVRPILRRCGRALMRSERPARR